MPRTPIAAILSIMTVAGAVQSAHAQQTLLPEIPQESVAVAFDTGIIQSSGRTEIAFTDALIVRDASWLRLRFDRLELGTGPEGESAIVKITSMLDGHVQYIDRDAAAAWQNTSAYFNGDGLIIEVIQPAGATPTRVTVKQADAGGADPTMVAERSICDGTDDRALSSDPRQGRVMPIGCTAWLIDDCNKCMLTAGHCGPADTAVIQFNVPLSTSGGTPVAPPPEDQYPVDPASIQSNGGQGVGNDWAYFGTLPNTSTNLTAYEAQGSVAFTLAPPDASTQTIRITGYGSTSSPVDPSWYLVQKTHTGSYEGVIGNGLQYRPDTTGGNSGSAVIDENNGTAIGIHTHAGCFNGGGANQGTIITYAPIQAALNNPLGVCAGPQPLTFAESLPANLQTGVNTFTLEAGEGCATEPVLGTARMFFSTDTGFVEVPMSANGTSLSVDTPAVACGDSVSFYFAIDTSDGSTFTLPSGGASNPFIRTAVDDLQIVAQSSFEEAAGFADASTGLLTTGGWELGVPANGGREDPPTDFDGSGQCWLTDNVDGNSDVDGSSAILLSPAYDFTSITAPQLSFAIWVGTNSPGEDVSRVDFSDDDGATWITVDNLTDGTAGWETRSYDVQSFVSLTNAFRFRIVAEDDPNDSILELGFDALSIDSALCNPADPCATDLSGDGFTDIGDLLILLQSFEAGVEGDVNGDGSTDVSDLLLLLGVFDTACP